MQSFGCVKSSPTGKHQPGTPDFAVQTRCSRHELDRLDTAVREVVHVVPAEMVMTRGLNCRSAGCDGHVLALERFTVPHEGPTGERLVSTAICDANKSVASEEAMHRALLGASAVLLLITDRDDPALVDRRLTALYAACRQKVRP